MDVLAPLLIILVLGAVVWLISAPLRAKAAGRELPADVRDAQRRRDLEIERDQKYAEIRELEMDLRTGKLSDADYRETDRALRAEAVDILHALDELGVATEAQRDADAGVPPVSDVAPAADEPAPEAAVAQSRNTPDA